MLSRPMSVDSEYLRPLADLAVRFGANVQPGQIVSVASEPGKEPLARAIAEVAYEQGAKFVDLDVFDVHVKHARMRHAAPDTLDYVPPWIGQRVLALGEHRAARIALTGPAAPHLMDDVDPALLGRDMLPSVQESLTVVNERTSNWTVVPCPTAAWASLVHRDVEPDEALKRLWREIGRACRLDEPDPVSVWRARFERLGEVAGKLDDLHLDALRYDGPGTKLIIGLLPSSRWISGSMTTVDGIVHAPNLPTEEVFTCPDPERVDGIVLATKPLFTAGELIEGLRVRFERGRAVEIDADRGAGTLRTLAARDDGAARLGEVALVDRESRVGGLDRVFFNTLLDENAASHIALGQGIALTVEDPGDLARVNASQIHIDFMIGSDELAITGITDEGREVPLLREGAWQI
jgi:aminopeptidase